MSTVASLDAFLAKVAQRDGHQPEFLQAVREVFTSIWPFLELILNIVQRDCWNV